MVDRKIHKIDATNKSVGRLATQIAIILRGKNKTDFRPHIDSGDIVHISNISKLKFTGRKLEQKKYYKYSGYPGGMIVKKMNELNDKNPGDILKRAVREMLPPTRLRPAMLKRLIII